jgi:hypothetical protein
MTTDCGHPLCELIGGTCSLASGRSRGCRPGLAPRTVAPDVFEEVRALVTEVERERSREAAVRLAAIVRREARDDRLLVVLARDEDPELAAALSRLCVRRR